MRPIAPMLKCRSGRRVPASGFLPVRIQVTGASGFIGTALSRREVKLLKRAIDIVLSFILLLLALPLFGYVWCRIYFEDGRPVVFLQRRIGQAKREFGMFKFRSMVRHAEGEFARWELESPDLLEEYRRNNYKLRQDPRLLDVGAWLRRTSIDELPQLLNVLRGEMSLVGPRPRCVEHPEASGTFLVGESPSTPELVSRMANALGHSARMWPLPVSWLRLAGRIARREEEVRRLVGSVAVDTSLARTRFGWQPPFTLSHGAYRDRIMVSFPSSLITSDTQ